MRRSPLAVAAMAAFVLAAGNAHAEAVTYKLDPNHTVVLAQWDHGGYSHPVANFGQVDGTLVYDADNVAASSVQVTLPLAGLNSFVPKFDEHLRSDDFFDAAKYPNAVFRSTRVEAAGEGRLKVTGDLTIDVGGSFSSTGALSTLANASVIAPAGSWPIVPITST